MGNLHGRMPTKGFLSDVQDSLDKSQENYTLLVDEVSGTISYIGQAPIGSATSSSVWQIFKLDSSSGLTLKWADSTDAFSKIWDDRATYSYA